MIIGDAALEFWAALRTCQGFEKTEDQRCWVHRIANESEKYSKDVDCLPKNWSQLTTLFHYPAKHWQDIRTTNPIESSFAALKLQTKVTKGAGSKETAAIMAFKLLHELKHLTTVSREPTV